MIWHFLILLTTSNTCIKVHGSLRSLTIQPALYFSFFTESKVDVIYWCDGCVFLIPHHGESVSINSKWSGIAAAFNKPSSVRSEHPLIPIHNQVSSSISSLYWTHCSYVPVTVIVWCYLCINRDQSTPSFPEESQCSYAPPLLRVSYS